MNSTQTNTYVLLFGGTHERRQTSPAERVRISSVAKQQLQTVDVLEWHQVDGSSKEVAPVRVSSTT